MMMEREAHCRSCGEPLVMPWEWLEEYFTGHQLDGAIVECVGCVIYHWVPSNPEERIRENVAGKEKRKKLGPPRDNRPPTLRVKLGELLEKG